MLILGIESSCDETSAAIVKDGKQVLSNVVISQIKNHKQYGGVVPEVASRKHTENIAFVLDKCFDTKHCDGFAFTGVDVSLGIKNI